MGGKFGIRCSQKVDKAKVVGTTHDDLRLEAFGRFPKACTNDAYRPVNVPDSVAHSSVGICESASDHPVLSTLGRYIGLSSDRCGGRDLGPHVSSEMQT